MLISEARMTVPSALSCPVKCALVLPRQECSLESKSLSQPTEKPEGINLDWREKWESGVDVAKKK